MFICTFWSHSNRHHFVHIVEIYNVFPLHLYITILIIAFLEIVPHIFQQMRRAYTTNTFLLLLTILAFQLKHCQVSVRNTCCLDIDHILVVLFASLFFHTFYGSFELDFEVSLI